MGHQLLGIPPRSGPFTWYLHDPSAREGHQSAQDVKFVPRCHLRKMEDIWNANDGKNSEYTPETWSSAPSWFCLPLTSDGTQVSPSIWPQVTHLYNGMITILLCENTGQCENSERIMHWTKVSLHYSLRSPKVLHV